MPWEINKNGGGWVSDNKPMPKPEPKPEPKPDLEADELPSAPKSMRPTLKG